MVGADALGAGRQDHLAAVGRQDQQLGGAGLHLGDLAQGGRRRLMRGAVGAPTLAQQGDGGLAQAGEA